jgi:hypothetical protein
MTTKLMKTSDLPPSLMPNVAHAACLNQADNATLDQMMRGQAVLRSDCDEQLLLHFHMLPGQPAKVQALLIAAPIAAAAPKTLRFYANEPTLAFESADRVKHIEEVVIKWGPSAHHADMRVAHVVLNKMRNHTANHVAVLVVDNTSDGADDVTVVSDFVLCGADMAHSQGTTKAPQKG